MSNHWLPLLSLTVLLTVAVGHDIATRRIPNWLVLTGLVVGLACSLLANPEPGSPLPVPVAMTGGQSVLGALTGLAIMLPLYILRAMGAGDAKLMAAVGAFLGPLPVAEAALLTFVSGGLLSLAAALWSRSLSGVLRNLRLMAMVWASPSQAGLSLRDVQTTGRLPYSIAIAVGTGLQVWLAV